MDGSQRDVVGELLIEREARTKGLLFHRSITGTPGRLTYRVPIDVPVYDDERTGTITMVPPSVPDVRIDGPVCLRHRNADGSLCLWWYRDDLERVWVPSDGLLPLVNLVIDHAFCEEQCRRGHGWPRPEAPTCHRESSPSCDGR